ncbi:MAG: hypothetical protein PWQ91_816 [Eubacteriales bacterium]|nr:hypothetical protein [Eubacteriales bacterium]MDN5363755.1 hypothetical protein [Eubacteriales bacterium]
MAGLAIWTAEADRVFCFLEGGRDHDRKNYIL